MDHFTKKIDELCARFTDAFKELFQQILHANLNKQYVLCSTLLMMSFQTSGFGYL